MTDKKTPIDPITHDDQRVNIPTPELAPMMDPDDARPIKVAYKQRNPDLDPQLIWRGKDIDQTEITVDVPPIYLQEQVHPKAIIEDLRAGGKRNGEGGGVDLFDHFGITDDDREAEIEFYRHHRKWSNRMILGDGLQVMASLAEREGLKGQVQAIYIDPPYGIKFNSNFQWSTTSRDVKDGKLEHLTREPEQVKAFRDTWRDGIHSYLQYLRDRLVVARELLTESGSCFVQIGDENVHRVRALMDEVFGEENFVNTIIFKKKSATYVTESVFDEIIWYCKNREKLKVRPLFDERKDPEGESKFNTVITEPMVLNNVSRLKQSEIDNLIETGGRWARVNYPIVSQHPSETRSGNYNFQGSSKICGTNKQWRFSIEEWLPRIERSGRIFDGGGKSLGGVAFWDDWNQVAMSNIWTDMHGEKFPVYVVQTSILAVQRCLLMTTDPGDLVLDPTCGSGSTAHVAEQWGRRWITIDTSRVALALARARIMGAKYPWYLLKDSAEGQKKEAELTRSAPSTVDTYNDIRHGFVYQHVPHITLKSIANNTEIDTIWEQMQPAVEEARAALNAALQNHPVPFQVETGGRKGKKIDFTASGEVELPSGEMAPANGFMEWEIPREAPDGWPDTAKAALHAFWEARIARQKEIDASIAAKADHEYLYDKPYEDKKRVRVAGPFTVESLSPHRTQAVNEHGELIDEADAAAGRRGAGEQEAENYRTAILENLAKAGVQQAGREDRIDFTSLSAWPGEWLAAEGRYMEGETERRAGILIGPEYGTLQRADLVAAAREAADAGFDLVIACAFNFDAHTAEFQKLGRITVLQARMNADLHMSGDLKAGGGNLFVVFGEPDIEIVEEGDRLRVRLLGVDIFRPATGEVSSSDPEDIACWFIDTDYDEQSFFVRHAYFPGAEIPYKQLKTTLKAEVDEDAWESLKRTESRVFARPNSGRIAVKVINHLGDEVMKVIGI
ncbi:site-specific DNA-methyltransferase [Psychromarinibacter sp. C21-152]|uniref:site-specific DNA-methyltransferase (adenine-specific) n=1 Tax=Psychromarinibacter sediminicola TaxID=3033385 RepID=A0AAE3NYM8_9RHOB|nr:site-specific DNA-methyltransferase [Psychromarinibacter sediminicola]MDF0603315.1 site-specific DNA-methyltransferase [Psychromarinibacter sediminicola]